MYEHTGTYSLHLHCMCKPALKCFKMLSFQKTLYTCMYIKIIFRPTFIWVWTGKVSVTFKYWCLIIINQNTSKSSFIIILVLQYNDPASVVISLRLLNLSANLHAIFINLIKKLKFMHIHVPLTFLFAVLMNKCRKLGQNRRIFGF